MDGETRQGDQSGAVWGYRGYGYNYPDNYNHSTLMVEIIPFYFFFQFWETREDNWIEHILSLKDSKQTNKLSDYHELPKANRNIQMAGFKQDVNEKIK